jgi:uncharacterized membrane protein (UPF0127 family)
MIGREFIGFDGMLFLMGKGEHSFWMMNCIIPLDIIFIDKNLNVGAIFDDCLPCGTDNNCLQYCGEAKYVLEIDGGLCKKLSIEEGNRCTFTFDISE